MSPTHRKEVKGRCEGWGRGSYRRDENDYCVSFNNTLSLRNTSMQDKINSVKVRNMFRQ